MTSPFEKKSRNGFLRSCSNSIFLFINRRQFFQKLTDSCRNLGAVARLCIGHKARRKQKKGRKERRYCPAWRLPVIQDGMNSFFQEMASKSRHRGSRCGAGNQRLSIFTAGSSGKPRRCRLVAGKLHVSAKQQIRQPQQRMKPINA